MNKVPFWCVYKCSFSVSIHLLLDIYSVSVSRMREKVNRYKAMKKKVCGGQTKTKLLGNTTMKFKMLIEKS